MNRRELFRKSVTAGALVAFPAGRTLAAGTCRGCQDVQDAIPRAMEVFRNTSFMGHTRTVHTRFGISVVCDHTPTIPPLADGVELFVADDYQWLFDIYQNGRVTGERVFYLVKRYAPCAECVDRDGAIRFFRCPGCGA